MKASEDEKKNQLTLPIIEGVVDKIEKKLYIDLIVESSDWRFSKLANELL